MVSGQGLVGRQVEITQKAQTGCLLTSGCLSVPQRCAGDFIFLSAAFTKPLAGPRSCTECLDTAMR